MATAYASAGAHPYHYSADTRRAAHAQPVPVSNVVCKYWLAGRCNRQPCRFSHQSLPQQQHHNPNTRLGGHGGYGPMTARNSAATKTTLTKQAEQQQPKFAANNVHKSKDSYQITTSASSCSEGPADNTTQGIKTHPREAKAAAASERVDEDHACAHWMSGTCTYAEKCRFMHSWVSSKAMKDIDRIAQLKEHKKGITSIALPQGSSILYTGSRDGTLRACDANTGMCIDYINVGAEVGCIVTERSWVFVGVPNAIWAWNIETAQRLSLEGPVGQVYAMVVNHDTLFAACEDGNILAYKPCAEGMTFRLAATLKGHSKPVLSLAFSETLVYSGSEDRTIRCWDMQTLRCTHVLKGHSGAVACLIIWESYLFSGSLDKTIKVWAGTKDQGIEEIHTCYEEQGVMAFMGMTDAAEKSVLFVSCNDNFVRMYELRAERCLVNRGRLFTKKRVTTISFSGRHVFTGDASGNVDVWKWLGEPCT